MNEPQQFDIEKIREPRSSSLDGGVQPSSEDTDLLNQFESCLNSYDDVLALQSRFVDTPSERKGVALSDGIISRLGHAAVIQAYTQRRVVESEGEDGGIPFSRYVKWFLPNQPKPLPWCAFFVSWCLDTSAEGRRNRRVPWTNPGYVGSVYEWARTNKRLVVKPAHGDLFGFGDDHIGLVVGSNHKSGIFFTIEGNWSDRVYQRSVRINQGGVWFARVFSDR